MRDIVLVRDSEVGFAEFAKRLGYDRLLLVFDDAKQAMQSQAKHKGVLVAPSGIKNAKDKGLVAVCIGSREAIERGADIIFGLEVQGLKDRMQFRDSGLNQVLCKLARAQNVQVAFSLHDILAAPLQQRALILGRMMQNIRLCRKFGVRMGLGSFASDPFGMRGCDDVISLFVQLGMSQVEARRSLSGL